MQNAPMNDEQRFDRISAQFEAACRNTGTGIFADTSQLWQNVFERRSNFPSFAQFGRILAHDSAFADGIGMPRLAEIDRYAEKYRTWVSRYTSEVDAVELAQWPEPAFGAPTILDHAGYRASVIYIKNFALSKLVETAAARHHPKGSGLKVLEIGAGYGGVAEILLRKGVAGSYTVVDLPENLFLSAQYLQRTFPDRPAAIVDRAGDQDWKACDFRFVLANDIPLLDAESFDLVVNTLSLGEMPAATARAYVTWISTHLAPDGIFFSHNAHAVRGLSEVVQKQSEYGYDQFGLKQLFPQPSPAALLPPVHSVFVLGTKASGAPLPDDETLDILAAAMNLGLAAELGPILEEIAGAPSPAGLTFLDTLRTIWRATTHKERYTAAGTRVGHPECDLALEFIQGACAFCADMAQAREHFEAYLQAGRSPLAICNAALALTQMPRSEDQPLIVSRALRHVPVHLIEDLGRLSWDYIRARFAKHLETFAASRATT